MTLEEFSELFDVQYNNITSNQAPGLNEYEKSVFLTKAQDEIIKNYFTANSKGNNIQQGFDDSAKRQADFSVLMKTSTCASGTIAGSGNLVSFTYNTGETKQGEPVTKTVTFSVTRLDQRSHIYTFPEDVFIIVNESLADSTKKKYFQVIPLKYDEYTRLMSKPFKRPLKHQAWRLINSGTVSDGNYIKCVEIIAAPDYDSASSLAYTLRYLRRPLPIIVGDIDDLKINGKDYNDVKDTGCELDPILHEDILQRAVELAKVAWTANGQDNVQLEMAAGQRSE